MFLDKERLLRRVKSSPNGSELKIFLFIVLNQPSDGIKGYQTTKEQLAEDLNLKLTTIFKSLRWLKEELMIDELKLDQTVDFMVNPFMFMNDGDFKDRVNEWGRRVRLSDARERRLRNERRIRTLRKQKKLAQTQNS